MGNNINLQIGEQIRAYFENKSLQQQDIADRIGISQSAVSAYYRGKPFGKNAAKKWSDAFGFRVNWLLTGEGEMLVSNQPKVSAEEQPGSSGSLIEYLERKIKELERENADLLQENAVLKYENMMLNPRKGDAADAAGSLSADAI